MTTLEKFIAADQKTNEIESNGGVFIDGYNGAVYTKEYDRALLIAQRLYNELQAQGIDPFEI